ncbi:MAG: tetratricopeptide repeat protein [Candidatus Melainabacteria bacterium]|nr:tetratricopeptide repeat protein [Candidatus Melainabacteria bacterium]
MEEAWQNYKTLGERATGSLNYPYAEAMWAMAVLIAEEFGEKDPRYCFSIDWLSHVLLKQQKYALAERFLSRSWRLKTKVLGSSQLELARTLNTIAELYYLQGKWADAEQLCRRVYEVYVQQYGHDHPNTHTALSNAVLLEQTNAARTAAAGGQIQGAQQAQQVPGPGQPQAVQSSSSSHYPTVQAGVGQPQAVQSSSSGYPTVQSGVGQQGAQQQAVAQPISPSRPQPVKPTSERKKMDACESCGQPIDGEECVRCTSTTLRVYRMDERLT